MLKEYPLFIEGAEGFSAKVKDISEFLASTAHFRPSKNSAGDSGSGMTIRVT